MSQTVYIDPILLSKVTKPARYVGGEWNSIVKDHESVKFTVAYCFPDVYEVAMSHLGLRILYALLNERDDVAAERAYAPWPDMEALMRERDTLFIRWKRRRLSVISIWSALRCNTK